ncbi:MAG: glycosyl hydrolase [Gemmatimonadaceae bacterium]|nr:glycosyl hydrolase [Gemmatimonadaceae bacterium]
MNTLRTLALLAVPAAALVQPPAKPAAKAAPAAAKAAPLAPVTLDSTLLRGYRWRNIGPDRGGRSIAVSGVKGQKNVAYFGAVGGGLWKTTDGGENWFPVTDGQITSASVGAIAVSESNPDVIYIGMGESCIRGNIMPGDGIYKSTDAGKTWKHVGFRTVDAISKIRVDPTNPDIVYAAVFGKYSVNSTERGVYKSTDGGATWKRVLYRDDKTGAIDIALDRTNPKVMYAALWEAYRKEYQMSSGGPGSGLFKSTDGGESWTEITRAKGMPSGLVGRIGVATTAANPNRVYAIVENDNGGLFRSDDAGASWTLINGDRSIRQRAFYYTHVFADQKNADVVYAQNTSMFRSTDGGKTLMNASGNSHGDWHDLWIDPDDPTHLVAANDGGGAVTFNTAARFSEQDFPTEQFYHAITTAHTPYHVCGSQQDNSTLCTPSNWNNGGGFGRGGAGGGRGGPNFAGAEAFGGMASSYQVGGGEPGYIAADPNDPDVFYSGTNNGGYVDKFNRRLGMGREVNPYPWFYSGEPSKDIKERWQWTFPILFSQANPKALYVSSQRLWRSYDGGRTWKQMSPDLTRHAPETQEKSGGPITGDMNGPEVYGVIFSVGPSKITEQVIWTGSDDGLVHVTKNNGATWTNVTPKDMPEFGRVSQIDASKFDAGTAYISVRRPLLNDRAPYIFKTTDYGKTWTKIVNGLGAEDYVHAVREDPTRRGLLYAATQHGVYISYDDGANWQSLKLNMPDTPVADLIVEQNDLVIATHGRGFWILDNVAPLRQASPTVLAADAHLFAPPVGVRSAGGVQLAWFFKQAPKRAQLEILDSLGKVVRSFEGDTTRGGGAPAAGGGRRGGTTATFPLTPGLSRYNYDLRSTGIESFPGMIFWGAGTAGPALPSGHFTVRLTADGKAMTAPLTIVKNPLIKDVSDADLHAQFKFGSMVRDKTNEAQKAVIEIRRVKTQLEDRLKRAADDAALKEKGGTLKTNASAVEENVYQVRNQSGQDPLNFPIKVNNRLANLLSMSERGDGPPGTYMPEIFGILSKELSGYQATLDKVWKDDLAAVNKELARLKLPPLDPKCTVVTGCTVTP